MELGCLAKTRWHITTDIVTAALRWISASAALALHERGCFHLVLAGGNTPRDLYRRLQELQTDWSGWHIWFGDERCLPAADPARNSEMVNLAWLRQSAIPSRQIHVIPAELGAELAAADYLLQLRGLGKFDLVLLGLGEDGHTASLFPGVADALAVADVIAVRNAPKPPPDRVSMSARRLSDSTAVLFLVAGIAKREAVSAWQSGAAIPAAAICPEAGVDVLIEPVCMELKI